MATCRTQNSLTPQECNTQATQTYQKCIAAHPPTTLLEAAQQNNLPAFQKFMAATPTPNINLKNGDNDTALMLAVQHGNETMINALIAAKANLEIQDSLGYTALTWAVQNNNAAIVNALIAAKANVNVRDNYGTILQLAQQNYNFNNGKIEKEFNPSASVNSLAILNALKAAGAK